jgi:OOP family OmpA-OmpF porin
MRISSAILVAGLLAGLGGAASAETDGWYFGAEAGANFAPKIKFDAMANTWQQSQDTGYAILGQVGYGFGQWRLEGELGWRHNELSNFTWAAGSPSPSGAIGGVSFMANALYDFKTDTPWTPYLGAGIGGLNLNADNIIAGNTKVTNDSQTVFAYQGIAGLSYAVTDSLSLRADYHYMRTEKANLVLDSGIGGGIGQGTYTAHTVGVGFIVKFPAAAAPAPAPAMAPPPPPPAPPAPPPAPKPVQAAPIPKNFMVFFDFDKDVLTPEAKAIITQAADAAKKQHSTSIALTGYTDLSGTVPYNLKLSVRRGDAVKKMLVQLGIPANEISVVGKGKSDPLVPTKDGVKEPQNRRVQIILN